MLRTHEVQHIQQLSSVCPHCVLSNYAWRFQRENGCDRVERCLIEEKYSPVFELPLRAVGQHEVG